MFLGHRCALPQPPRRIHRLAHFSTGWQPRRTSRPAVVIPTPIATIGPIRALSRGALPFCIVCLLRSIITAAPLKPDPVIREPICLGEACSRCLNDCPAAAFGAAYQLQIGGHDHTVAKTDIEACRGYYQDSALGSQCGRECMTACPIGRIQSEPDLSRDCVRSE